MSKIVVNKHYKDSSNITPSSFLNLGEIVISNEPGFEGIFIINTNNEVIKVGASSGTSGQMTNDYQEFLKKYYLTSGQTVEMVNKLSGAVVENISKQSGISSSVQADWNETNSGASSYIANKPAIPSTLSGFAGYDQMATKDYVDSLSATTLAETKAVVSEEVAKIVASADTKYDTLKEIADWIANDETNSAGVVQSINNLNEVSAATRIAELETKVQELLKNLENIHLNDSHIYLTSEEYQILVQSGSVMTEEYGVVTYNDNCAYFIYESTGSSTGGTTIIIPQPVYDGTDTIEIPQVAIIEDGVLDLSEYAFLNDDGMIEFVSSKTVNNTVSEGSVIVEQEGDTLSLLSQGVVITEENGEQILDLSMTNIQYDQENKTLILN